ncbi:hypothetical protein DEJ50_17410 [Streptomyces venezuelae]|uniref:Glycosyltransferase RgtA/B/C/D-like domain-containing protein n=1 Tax=Streptomyces venezuelae TaxID=54571 RepID=A0A5P2D437_STRVZ|nr:hypothetical protein DEJ50_17410 [Streptomyces venezuelae]
MPVGVVAVAAFVAVRVVGVAVVAACAWWSGKDPVAVLGASWDSVWYIGIAEEGYGRTQVWPEIGSVQSDLAFFPLYPGLMRGVCALLPWVGPAGAGLLVAWGAAVAGAVGVYRVGELVAGARAGLLLVVLWGVLPHSVVLGIAYTEALLAALAAWTLYAVLRGRWLWAAALAVLAGLTRPTGIAVAAAVSVAAVYELLLKPRAPLRVWAAALLAPAGWAAHLLAVGIRRGDPLGGYFAVQRDWGSYFDFGHGVAGSVARVLARGPGGTPLVTAVVPVVIVAALVLAVLLARGWAPLPLLVYCGTLLVITLGGAGFFESKPRFLLPAFPLLLPAAAAMARARPRTAVAVTAALAGLSFGYGTYLLISAPLPL